MSGIRISRKQRRAIKFVLIVTAALLLLGLIIDAAGQTWSPTQRTINGTAYNLDPITSWHYSGAVGESGGATPFISFISALLRSPRLYIAGLLVGLAVFVGPKDEKA